MVKLNKSFKPRKPWKKIKISRQGIIGLIIIGFISNISVGFMSMKSIGGSASIVIVTPELIIFSLAFATIIGIISGLIPARKAAKLQIVEAMRSE